jgi:hypothetical protein
MSAISPEVLAAAADYVSWDPNDETRNEMKV